MLMDFTAGPNSRKTFDMICKFFFDRTVSVVLSSCTCCRLKRKSTFLNFEYAKCCRELCRNRRETSATAHKSSKLRYLKVSMRQSPFKSPMVVGLTHDVTNDEAIFIDSEIIQNICIVQILSSFRNGTNSLCKQYLWSCFSLYSVSNFAQMNSITFLWYSLILFKQQRRHFSAKNIQNGCRDSKAEKSHRSSMEWSELSLHCKIDICSTATAEFEFHEYELFLQ